MAPPWLRRRTADEEEDALAGAMRGGREGGAEAEPGTAADPPPSPPSSSATGLLNGCESASGCRLATGVPADAAARAIQKRLAAALVLALLFVGVELAGGLIAHSLAVVADAAHMMSDAVGLVTALVAARVGAKAAAAGGGHTFGFHRVEVLGALASTVLTYIVTTVLVVEAASRFKEPEGVDGKVMCLTALAGVGVNVAMLAILGPHHHHGHAHDHGHGEAENPADADAHADASPDGRHHHHHHHPGSINLRGAFVHVLGDCVQSLGVVAVRGERGSEVGGRLFRALGPASTSPPSPGRRRHLGQTRQTGRSGPRAHPPVCRPRRLHHGPPHARH